MPECPLSQTIAQKSSNPHRWHFPGHGGQAPWPASAEILGSQVYQADFTEIEGLDDLHNPQGVIAQAQQQAAQAFGAKQSFFLVNGSSIGLQTLILSFAKNKQKIILPRSAHRSVLSGLILSGAEPIWLCPPLVPDFNCPGAISPEQVQEVLTSYPHSPVLTVYPDYQGLGGDLKKLSTACSQLLVDEAHGCHFYFHPDLPPGALECGAEACVQSLHKTGGSLTQTALLHSQGLKTPELARNLSLLQTTSPSYPLMLSLEGAVNFWLAKGRIVLEQLLNQALELRQKLRQIPGLKLLDESYLGKSGLKFCDPLRLVISLVNWDGYDLAEMLAQRHQIFVERAASHFVVLLIGLNYSPSQGELLVQALLQSSKLPSKPPKSFLGYPSPGSAFLSPREAFLSFKRALPLEDSAGQISADWVAVYPPGIPLIMPGEIITPEIRDYLQEVRRLKLPIQTSGDPQLNFLQVVEKL